MPAGETVVKLTLLHGVTIGFGAVVTQFFLLILR